MRAAYAAGQRDFGESYVQELVQKADELKDLPDLRLHLIGHLQKNKARHVVRHAAMIHTLDSLGLVKELSKRLAALDEERLVPVLVEVNVGRDPNKSGCAPEELAALLDAIRKEKALELRGLMTLPPLTDDPAEARQHFDALRQLRDEHDAGPELSMGMTRDLEHAVLAGSTWVRVGTGIFGPRER